MMHPLNDFVIAWTEGTPGAHDKKPIMASQYLLGLELALEKQISENSSHCDGCEEESGHREKRISEKRFSDERVVRNMGGDVILVYRETDL